jgi:hypothetical protein
MFAKIGLRFEFSSDCLGEARRILSILGKQDLCLKLFSSPAFAARRPKNGFRWICHLGLIFTNFSSDYEGIRILALDGGGIRVLTTIRLLSALESLTKVPIRELFDVVACTSTGK